MVSGERRVGEDAGWLGRNKEKRRWWSGKRRGKGDDGGWGEKRWGRSWLAGKRRCKGDDGEQAGEDAGGLERRGEERDGGLQRDEGKKNLIGWGEKSWEKWMTASWERSDEEVESWKRCGTMSSMTGNREKSGGREDDRQRGEMGLFAFTS